MLLIPIAPERSTSVPTKNPTKVKILKRPVIFENCAAKSKFPIAL